MKHTTRAIAALLVIMLALPMFLVNVSADEIISVQADGFDKVRDYGELIIYTPAFGDNTLTNAWGKELIVIDNVATEFAVGGSNIPTNGFVLSGHDDVDKSGNGKLMGTWILDNIELGDYVYYTPEGVITVSKTEVVDNYFYSFTTSIAGINCTRETDALVVYNTAGKTTGTNDWGYEVVCDGGYVTAMGGNNNKVGETAGSIVVSGHGTSVTWLQTNVKIGMRVTYNEAEKTVTFHYDENAAIKSLEIQKDNIWEYYNNAVARYDNFDYEAAKAAIEAIETDFDAAISAYESNSDGIALVKAGKKIEQAILQARLMISESPTVEYRGAWIRPTETTKAQVEATVQQLYDNGINTICVETLYNCGMIMPIPEDSGILFEQLPFLNGFDLLQAYVDACHARDMELHLWLPVFYVGNTGLQNLEISLGIKKPEWVSLTNNGKLSQEECYSSEAGGDGYGYIMLDPSNREAKDHLLKTYRYILENYDVDCFQLDYIRYFEGSLNYDLGYNETAKEEFKAKYGEYPKFDTKWKLWDEWVQFRCDYITDFVGEIRSLIDEVAPEVLLGADVGPDPEVAKESLYQDYFKWLEDGLLDILFPMAYGYGYEEAIEMQVENCGNNAFIAIGLGIFMSEMTPEIMEEQVKYNIITGTDGSIFFENTAYIRKDTGAYLKDSVYRNNAITPTLDMKKASLAKIDYAKSRINDIIKPLGGISEDDANMIISAIDAFATSIESFVSGGQKYAYDPAKYNALIIAINNSSANDQAKARMLADIESVVKVYSVQSKNGDSFKIPEGNLQSDTSIDASVSASGNESSDNAVSLPMLITVIVICVIVIIGSIATAIIVLKKPSAAKAAVPVTDDASTDVNEAPAAETEINEEPKDNE